MKSIVPRFFMHMLAMVLVLSGVPRFSGAEERSLTLGVLAIRPKQETITRWQPLANYLSEKLDNHQVRILALERADELARVTGAGPRSVSEETQV